MLEAKKSFQPWRKLALQLCDSVEAMSDLSILMVALSVYQSMQGETLEKDCCGKYSETLSLVEKSSSVFLTKFSLRTNLLPRIRIFASIGNKIRKSAIDPKRSRKRD